MIGTSSSTNGLGLGDGLSREFLVERRGALAAALAFGFFATASVLAFLALWVVFVSAVSFEVRFVPPFFVSLAAALSLFSSADDLIREEERRAGLTAPGSASFDLTVLLPRRVLILSDRFDSATALDRVVLVRFTAGALLPSLPSLLDASPYV